MRQLGPLTAEDLRRPRPGPGVCVQCFNTTDGSTRCYACAASRPVLDAIVPISYSVAHEPLHQALWRYKRTAGPFAERAAAQLAAILAAFLVRHEACVARAAGAARFDIVTTVPSGGPARFGNHPLADIVGRCCPPTHARHEGLLSRTSKSSPVRTFDAGRFVALRGLRNAAILLVDDTWTTGASAQSAAAALKEGGAGRVAAVVIGRHINRDWRENDTRLRALSGRFSFDSCVVCAAGHADADESALHEAA